MPVGYRYENGHKIYQQFSFQGPTKCTQIGIFGMQMWEPCFAQFVILHNPVFSRGLWYEALKLFLKF
jgi:hypothetical protein